MTRSKWVMALGTLLAGTGLVALPLVAAADTCYLTSGLCNASVTTSVFTGTPTIICAQPDQVIRIDVTPGVDDCIGLGQTFYKCSSNTTGIKLVGVCGATLTIRPSTGHNWGSTVANCDTTLTLTCSL